ncbi:MAG: DNA primase [Candidatus Diapherotrites archaeon]|uniref:DNA primase DnaG n=1 Tax=Candidatus Iainarchaeum sp. TaxID=3101447 RepID=A0A939C4J2_9ARCH|nr:DNA primase [Candidatus Diapherotrites archaeon]
MAKTYLSTVKYLIKAKFSIEGVVDRHDIIGAIFGQSEGLVGEDMDLKELQQGGKLGRIEVDSTSHSGKTSGTITVPSGMDRVKTSILAAAIESVDKVGPCDASFETLGIEDTRGEKRKAVAERAKQLLQQMNVSMPETDQLAASIVGDMRGGALEEYGKDRLPAGPDVEKSDEVIVVEGRADVLNLLRHGIKNCIALNGAKRSETISELSRRKSLTVFVDGDRGGILIARQLGQTAKIDSLAKAPAGKEVEELALKEILAALRKKRPMVQRPGTGFGRPAREDKFERPSTGFGRPAREDRYPRESTDDPMLADLPPRESRPTSRFDRPKSRFDRPPRGIRRPQRGTGFRVRSDGRGPMPRPGRGRPGPRMEFSSPAPVMDRPAQDLGEFNTAMKELENSLKARFLDEKMKTVKEMSVRDLLQEMSKKKKIYAVVLDGIVTKRLAEQAEKSGVENLVGVKKGKVEETGKVKIQTMY